MVFRYMHKDKLEMVAPDKALGGRDVEMSFPSEHFVNGHSMVGPHPEGYEMALFGMGCFWGAERVFWQLPGVWVTAVGYAGGFTPNPSYEEVCSGRTGHTEAVLVVFDPSIVSYETVVRTFWENHDPTQGMRQGNDMGTQYRSFLGWYSDEQKAIAERSREEYQTELTAAGYGEITTEVVEAAKFSFAEGYHQQYLAKNPGGYCGLGGTGVPMCAGGIDSSVPQEQ